MLESYLSQAQNDKKINMPANFQGEPSPPKSVLVQKNIENLNSTWITALNQKKQAITNSHVVPN